jgi:hypothetical protein
MDAILSQKHFGEGLWIGRPFWRRFVDWKAILALQEMSMSMLCNVVVELQMERNIPGLLKEKRVFMEKKTEK